MLSGKVDITTHTILLEKINKGHFVSHGEAAIALQNIPEGPKLAKLQPNALPPF